MTDTLIQRLAEALPELTKPKKKPTIHELEEILERDDTPPLRLMPDGSTQVLEINWELVGVLFSIVREWSEEQRHKFHFMLAESLNWDHDYNIPKLSELDPETVAEVFLKTLGDTP